MRLHPLTEGDFYRILTETEFGIVDQNKALLGTEGVDVVYFFFFFYRPFRSTIYSPIFYSACSCRSPYYN